MYTYLLFISVAFALVLAFSFIRKIGFIQMWKGALPAILISTLIFTLWELLFSWLGIWTLNKSYISGIYLMSMPLEQLFALFTASFAFLFIYASIEVLIPKDPFYKLRNLLAVMLLLTNIGLVVLFSDRIYTLYTNLSLAFLWIVLLILRHTKFFGKYFLSFIICLLPFFMITALLTSRPFVLYNDLEIMGVRLFTVPVEDLIYFMLLFLLNAALFEAFRNRPVTASASLADA